jgi:hypothetical protein
MKKMLMLAACASQLLLLPQINAMNDKIIKVSKDFEIDNGVQGLDRDTYSEVARVIVKVFPKSAVTSFRNFYGFSDEIFALTTQVNFRTEFGLVLSAVQNRIINIFQRKTVANEIFSEKNTLFMTPYLHSVFNTILFASYGRRCSGSGGMNNCKDEIFFESRCLSFGNKSKTLYSYGMGFPCKGNGQPVKRVERINGELFAFLEGPHKRGIDVYVCEISRYKVSLVPFFTQDTFKLWPADLDIESQNVMAYGNNKYVIMTGNGIAYVKTEVWKRHETSIFEMLKSRIGSKNIKNSNVLRNIKMVYGNGMFVLTFNYEYKTYFYTSRNGEDWEYKKTGTGYDDMPIVSIAGSQLGFTYVSYSGNLYYSESADIWIRVEKDGFPSFSKVFGLDSQFFKGSFVVVTDENNNILLGTRVKGGGIGWFKTELSIFFYKTLERSGTINNIICDNDGNVFITGGFFLGWVACL